MKQPSPLFFSDLFGCKIVTADGKTLGHVLNIQLTHEPAYTIALCVFLNHVEYHFLFGLDGEDRRGARQ